MAESSSPQGAGGFFLDMFLGLITPENV